MRLVRALDCLAGFLLAHAPRRHSTDSNEMTEMPLMTGSVESMTRRRPANSAGMEVAS